MPIRQSQSGENHELFVSGRVDTAVAAELEKSVLAAVNGGATEILVNLSGTDFISTSGIRVIIQYWRLLKGKGKKLRVTHPSPAVSDILQMTGIREAVMDDRAAKS